MEAGILRLGARAALPPDSAEHPTPENPAETGQTCLEVPAETAVGVLGKARRGEICNDLAVPLASLEVIRWYLT